MSTVTFGFCTNKLKIWSSVGQLFFVQYYCIKTEQIKCIVVGDKASTISQKDFDRRYKIFGSNTIQIAQPKLNHLLRNLDREVKMELLLKLLGITPATTPEDVGELRLILQETVK